MSKLLFALLFNLAGMFLVCESQIEQDDPRCPYCASYPDCQGETTGLIWDCICKDSGKWILLDAASGKRCAKEVKPNVTVIFIEGKNERETKYEELMEVGKPSNASKKKSNEVVKLDIKTNGQGQTTVTYNKNVSRGQILERDVTVIKYSAETGLTYKDSHGDEFTRKFSSEPKITSTSKDGKGTVHALKDLESNMLKGLVNVLVDKDKIIAVNFQTGSKGDRK